MQSLAIFTKSSREVLSYTASHLAQWTVALGNLLGNVKSNTMYKWTSASFLGMAQHIGMRDYSCRASGWSRISFWNVARWMGEDINSNGTISRRILGYKCCKYMYVFFCWELCFVAFLIIGRVKCPINNGVDLKREFMKE